MTQITTEYWEEDDLFLQQGFDLGNCVLEEVFRIANHAELLLKRGDRQSARVVVQRGYDLVQSYDSREIFTVLS
jgi:hypothetical protein